VHILFKIHQNTFGGRAPRPPRPVETANVQFITPVGKNTNRQIQNRKSYKANMAKTNKLIKQLLA